MKFWWVIDAGLTKLGRLDRHHDLFRLMPVAAHCSLSTGNQQAFTTLQEFPQPGHGSLLDL